VSEVGPARIGIPAAVALAGVAYIASLAGIAAGAAGPAALLLAVGITAGSLALTRSPADPRVLVALWAPVHLAVAASGSLDSPLLPLVGAWVLLVILHGRVPPTAALPVPLLLVPALHLGQGAGLPPVRLVELAVLGALGALGAAAARLHAARPISSAPSAASARPLPPGNGSPVESAPPGDDLLGRFMELARLSTDAHETALWSVDTAASRAVLMGHAGLPDRTVPPESMGVEGHPFVWALEERLHLHLERGRRTLPAPWAEQMLIVPLDTATVLAFAYAGSAPPAVEAAAVAAGRVLSELLDLSRLRDEHGERSRRTRALHEAIQNFRGDVDLAGVVGVLSRTLREQTGAHGVAVAVYGEDGQGELVLVQPSGDHSLLRGDRIGESASRLALAMKHETLLVCGDLARERDQLPLVKPGERWERAPRSAIVAPVATAAGTSGGVVIWHPEPDRFSEDHEEYVELLCTVAAAPLRSVLRYEDLDRRASSDPLTGLANRRAFEARLASTAHLLERYGRPFALIILDVDHFKKFNDTWGHEAGDRVLQHIAELLRSSVREVDLPARLGGEEFVVLLPETDLAEAVDAAERIRKSVEARPVYWQGRPLRVTASFGAAACPACCAAPSEILATADAALYTAKDEGRNRVVPAVPLAPVN
jgi:diguanylate cyclase (GGDEF)-like protein